MLDERIRFTEDYYATKEEVEQAYNTSLIDSIWDRIVKYRSLFTVDINLKSIDRSPFMLTLTKTLQNRISMCERKIVKIFIKYDKLCESKRQEFDEIIGLKFFNEISGGDETISKEMLLHLIRNDVSTFPGNLYPLYYYSSAWKYYKEHCYDNIDENLINKVYQRVIGGEEKDEPITYRINEIETPHYFQSDYIYKASPVEHIPQLINELIDFSKQDNISSLVKAIISIFYFKYIKPFDYCNEEVASMLAKIIMSKDDFDKAAFFLNFEAIAFDNYQRSKELVKYVQKTLDITYYVIHYFNLIEEDVNYILGLINDYENSLIEEERISGVEKEVQSIPFRQITSTNFNQSIPIDLQGKSEVALPVFPSGLDSNAIDAIVLNLLEVYPYLKPSQAHFYASHCTIGKHYTIAQYKKEEGVAYETARTSMDFLAEQGFYTKSMVRNKFVYTPIPRR